ncbi:MAG: hypothetical protein A2W23_08710 [Planctomycetes bacterium RBG_16_43_13]|nr:MAG: hypothetical protein A2W23_08710 [Planctomycetes bacterium RBG_16_43_13]
MRTFALLLVVVVMSLTVGWNFWDGEATDDTAYFPLKVGYKWTYTFVIKVAAPEASYEAGEVKIEVTGTEKVGDVEGFVVEESDSIATSCYVVDEEGVKEYYKEGNNNNLSKQLVLKFPLKKGSKWSSSEMLVENDSKNEGEEEIEVPAGKMKCWKISRVVFDNAMKMEKKEMWFARDIGIVKESVKGAGLEFTRELKSFSKGEDKKGNEGEKK